MKNLNKRLMASLFLALMIFSIGAFAVVVNADSDELFHWKVVWVEIQNSELPSHLGIVSRLNYKISIAGAQDYWEADFGAPLRLCQGYQEEYASYSSVWSFSQAWESGTIHLTNGQNVPRGGRIFMVDGSKYIGNFWNSEVELGRVAGSMFDGYSDNWSWSGSIVCFLQRRIFGWFNIDGHDIVTSYNDVDHIVRRGLGSVMGLGTCWFGDHIPFYTCLMETMLEGGSSVAGYLCGSCTNWFRWTVAMPRGWLD